MLTRLDAINRMLTVVGQRPVNSLSAPVPPIVATAESILDETNQKHQARGWHFNVEPLRELTPDGAGEIVLGSTVLGVQGEQTHRFDNFYVIRGGKLYDATNDTFIFDSPVKLTLVRLVAFENCPYIFQDYVVAAAQRLLHGRIVADPTRQRELASDEGRAFTELQRFEAEVLNANVFDNPHAASMISRRRPRKPWH